MTFAEFRRQPAFLTSSLFALAVLTGWSVFNLQAISIVRLLQEAGIEALPLLMIVQGALSWLLLRLGGRAAQSSAPRLLVASLFLGLAVVLAAAQYRSALHSQVYLLFALYILSQLLVAALRMGLHVNFSQRVSILRNPQMSIQLGLAEEFGTFLGVLSLLYLSTTRDGRTSSSAWIWAALPFALALMTSRLLFLKGEEPQKAAPPPGLLERLRQASQHFQPLALLPQSAPPTGRQDRRLAPYLPSLLLLFTLVALLKGLQWFGLAYGLSEAARGEGGQTLLRLFSRLSLVQSLLTLSILVASFSFSKKISTWSWGFRILLCAQALGGAVLGLSPLPFVLMGGEVGRKVLEHGFLGRSLQLLTATLPESDRLSVRHMLERRSTSSGTLLAGILAFVFIQGWLPLSCLGLTLLAGSIWALRKRAQVFQALTEFHLARLSSDRLRVVTQAAFVLADPECSVHHAALLQLLDRKPRPAVIKSLLHALGRMRYAPVVPVLERYLENEREDVQVAAARALDNYHGHQINLQLLKALRNLMRSNQGLRSTVMRELTRRLRRLAIPYLLEVLENRRDDERVVANTLEALGEIARQLKDRDLMDSIAHFLSSSCPRRARANAIVALYQHPRHRPAALECFDRLLTSRDTSEQASAAYIAGVLGLSGHEGLIARRSQRLDHRDPTHLVALLRLGNPQAPRLLAHALIEEDEAFAQDVLVRLAAVPVGRRSQVFLELTQNWPDWLDLALLRMRKSQRDFDADRELLSEEARRLGLRLAEEQAWPPPAKAA